MINLIILESKKIILGLMEKKKMVHQLLINLDNYLDIQDILQKLLIKFSMVSIVMEVEILANPKL